MINSDITMNGGENMNGEENQNDNTNNDPRTPRKRKIGRKLLGWSLVALTFGGAGASYVFPWKTSHPDLNKDGIQDLVQTNVYGNLVPFKGVQFGTEHGDYLTLGEMEAITYFKHKKAADRELAPYRAALKNFKAER